jgi:hypothetical protein
LQRKKIESHYSDKIKVSTGSGICMGMGLTCRLSTLDERSEIFSGNQSPMRNRRYRAGR